MHIHAQNGIPTRVDVAMTVLGMGCGNPGDPFAAMGDALRSLKSDKGDVPTSPSEPRQLTSEEEAVRKSALEVMRLYLSGENDFADPTPEPFIPGIPPGIGMPSPEARRDAMRAGYRATVEGAVPYSTQVLPEPCIVIGGQTIPLEMDDALRILSDLRLVPDPEPQETEPETAGSDD